MKQWKYEKIVMKNQKNYLLNKHKCKVQKYENDNEEYNRMKKYLWKSSKRKYKYQWKEAKSWLKIWRESEAKEEELEENMSA